MTPRERLTEMKRINLALQGGGAHGAFTWGVLDRLLEEDDIEIASISGASAGALNGAAVKAGLLTGGREGARQALEDFWSKMGALTDERMFGWITAWFPEPKKASHALEYSWPFMAADTLARLTSPYAMGPFYKNPLRPIVEEFNFDRVCALEGPELFVCATNVRDGKVRVFTHGEISTDAILASACLPTLFQAVEIDDPKTGRREAFWDGGFTGNPALFPMFDPKLPNDILIVNINPVRREKLPVTPQQIQNRINEISFNSSLLRELRAISFVQRLIGQGSIEETAMKNAYVHMIADDVLMNDLSVATKQVPLPSVLTQLKSAGRTAADAFLAAHKDDLNERQTVDLAAMFG